MENQYKKLLYQFHFLIYQKNYLRCALKCELSVNPIALRKAKIAFNFGLSECNRINDFQVCKYVVLSTLLCYI